MTRQRIPEATVLGGGCFRCPEAMFQQMQGMQSVVSGCAGGYIDHLSYRAVRNDNIGHAKVVTVKFDPAMIPYREILDIFFTVYDLATVDRQGNDVGPQYRLAILAQTSEQLATAHMATTELGASDIFKTPIVTELVDAADGKTTFWRAEDEYQNYFCDRPVQDYRTFAISPKAAKLHKQFAHRLQG